MNRAKYLCLILVTMLLLCACGNTSDPEKNDVLSPAANQNAYALEGDGFDSPDEAVLAYLDAMSHGDVHKMLSTFAIESLVDHYDIVADFERTGIYGTFNTYSIPGENAYTRSILLLRRQSTLTNVLLNQYLSFNLDDTSVIGTSMTSSAFGELGYISPQQFFSDLSNPKWLKTLANMRYETPLTNEQLQEVLPDSHWEDTDMIAQMIENKQTVYGFEDYASVAIKVHLDGRDYYFFMDTACYNGKWYNFEHGGIMAQMIGVSAYDGGFFLIEE